MLESLTHRSLMCLAAVAAAASLVTPPARAAGNASAAAGFIEDAQNKDGGFGAKPGRRSDPTATLWASVALLAAGRNPRDEWIKNGDSADDYLLAHRSSYTSLDELGLLALVQSASRFSKSLYGNPAAKLTPRLSESTARENPKGVALAIFGLLATDTAAARATASSAAEALASTTTSDGAWGPAGNADSASTALVLQALAATGAANADTPAVKSGVAYLHAAQTNDGAIAESMRVDKATAGGSVAATAFTIQALSALGLPTLKTPTGKTVRQGLTQYQQRASGGLTSRGALYSNVAPSVVETAKAFPAFNGVTFPPASVASKTGGPQAARSEKGGANGPKSKHVSAGNAARGVAGAGAANGKSDSGAFKHATVDGNAKKRSDKAGDAANPAKGAGKSPPTGGGTDVSGTVVGTGPRLATKAGADDGGLTNEQRATITLAAALALLSLLGGFLERLRPTAPGAPSRPIVAVRAARRALAPIGRGAARAAGFAAATAGPAGRAPSPRRRWPLLVALLIGAAMIALPAAVQMFDRAPKGAAMIKAFEPYMSAQRLAGFQRDIREVDAYSTEALKAAPALLLPKAAGPAAAKIDFLRRYPQIALFSQQWPGVHRTFTRLLGTIEANKGNYEAVLALPSFRLFPWFFVIPGALLVMLALAGLFLGGRPRTWIPLRRATIALGVGLVLAPVAFQMFDRAPKGGRMVTAFKTIETRKNVQNVQGDFGTIAVGQGAIRTELMPRLKARGMSDAEIKKALPAAVTLQDRWVHILNDITPMIGVMSDNVGNYDAVAALPPFPIFPWLFLIPGLLVVGLVLLAGTRPPSASREVPTAEPAAEEPVAA